MAANKNKLLICMCLFLLLSGCSFKDIDKRFFVVTVGVDYTGQKKNPYEVSLKLAIPSASPKIGESHFILVSEKAPSISEAIRRLKSNVDKELDFGHAKVIVFGEGLVETDIRRTVEFFARRRDIQMVAWLAEGRPSAKAVMQIKPKSERLPSNTLFLSFGQTGTETPYITSTYLFDFRRKLFDHGVDPVLPAIQANKKEQLLVINESVVLRGKKDIHLTKEQTRLFNLLDGGFSSVHLNVRKDGRYFLVSANQPKASYTLNTEGKEPYVTYKLKVRGIIEESFQDLSAKDLPKYSKMAEPVLEKRIKRFLEDLQKQGVDPIGFGLRYRAQHTGTVKEEMRRWEELYPKLKFRIQVHVDIKSTGLTE